MVRKTKAAAEATRLEIIDSARAVFHRFGVARTSLEKVAQDAGVTRGAIYWHFSNKAALFYAVRERCLDELDPVERLLLSPEFDNPLDAIEASLLAFIDVLEQKTKVRETFEIMSLRCEYVDEFADVLVEINKPCHNFLAKLVGVYHRAAEKGVLRASLDPQAMAYDTVTFTTGLFRNWLAAAPGDEFRARAKALVRSHVALRRGA